MDKVSLEKQKSLLIREVADDLKKYKENLNKWERMGLDKASFTLALGNAIERYEKKSSVYNQSHRSLTAKNGRFTAKVIKGFIDSIHKDFGDDVTIDFNYNNGGNYGYPDNYYYGRGNASMGVTIYSIREESDEEFSGRVSRSLSQRYGYAMNADKRKAKKEAKAKSDLERKAKSIETRRKRELSELNKLANKLGYTIEESGEISG